MKNFHCCATCQHYLIVKSAQGTLTKCARLGFDTKPTYQFDCWNPKVKVAALMKNIPPGQS